MDVEVKIKEDMKKLGCKCNKKIALAYHLYIYLVDEKLMYDTEYCYNKDIDTLYVVARPNKNEKINIYVPIPTSFDGLAERQSAEKTSQIRQKEDRRSFINSELKKNESEILNDALNGGFVDDDDVCQVLD
ncbi:unnamed protein product, partial [Brenthis ino]